MGAEDITGGCVGGPRGRGGGRDAVTTVGRFYLLTAIEALGEESYAGAPLATSEGHVLGTLGVLAHEPTEWHPDELRVLTDLAGRCGALSIAIDVLGATAAAGVAPEARASLGYAEGSFSGKTSGITAVIPPVPGWNTTSSISMQHVLTNSTGNEKAPSKVGMEPSVNTASPAASLKPMVGVDDVPRITEEDSNTSPGRGWSTARNGAIVDVGAEVAGSDGTTVVHPAITMRVTAARRTRRLTGRRLRPVRPARVRGGRR